MDDVVRVDVRHAAGHVNNQPHRDLYMRESLALGAELLPVQIFSQRLACAQLLQLVAQGKGVFQPPYMTATLRYNTRLQTNRLT